MNGAGEAVFIDSNVLVDSAVAESPWHQAARQAIDDATVAGGRPWISRQVLREFLAVMTRPQPFTPPLAPAVLAPVIRRFAASLHVADETAEVSRRLLVLLEQIPVGGKQVHDANIVAAMQTQGVRRLLTANVADFTRFDHLIAIVPLNLDR